MGLNVLQSSPSLLGEGDRSRSEWWRGSGIEPLKTMCASLPLHPRPLIGGPPPRDKLGEDLRNGFTLIELMVVLFIIGLVAGAVVLSLPGDSAALSEDADRFAARVAAARDEAVVSARPIAVWIAPSGYGFDTRQDRQWVPLNAHARQSRLEAGDGGADRGRGGRGYLAAGHQSRGRCATLARPLLVR